MVIAILKGMGIALLSILAFAMLLLGSVLFEEVVVDVLWWHDGFRTLAAIIYWSLVLGGVGGFLYYRGLP